MQPTCMSQILKIVNIVRWSRAINKHLKKVEIWSYKVCGWHCSVNLYVSLDGLTGGCWAAHRTESTVFMGSHASNKEPVLSNLLLNPHIPAHSQSLRVNSSIHCSESVPEWTHRPFFRIKSTLRIRLCRWRASSARTGALIRSRRR